MKKIRDMIVITFCCVITLITIWCFIANPLAFVMNGFSTEVDFPRVLMYKHLSPQCIRLDAELCSGFSCSQEVKLVCNENIVPDYIINGFERTLQYSYDDYHKYHHNSVYYVGATVYVYKKSLF